MRLIPEEIAALVTLLGSLWEPYMVPHENSHHWFLGHRETGEVLDDTVEQFVQIPAYEKSISARFGRRTSAAAEILLWRVLHSLGAGATQERSGI